MPNLKLLPAVALISLFGLVSASSLAASSENISPSTVPSAQQTDHLKSAKALMSKQNWSQALKELKESSEYDPKDQNCWNLMGICYMQKGKLTEAKDAYDKVRKLTGGKDDVPKFVTEQGPPQTNKSAEQRLSESQAADKKKQDQQIYMTDLQRRIKRNWHPNAPYLTDNVVVNFKINRQGRISCVKIKTSSGNSECDRAAVDAVSNTTGGSLPEELADEIDVQFTFDKLTLI
ncbi:MAG: TonB family protein [Candidatus Obscuribacterales bacterium]|nr:TonB family protein [Candidatus Obscuribacterales bacterium]